MTNFENIFSLPYAIPIFIFPVGETSVQEQEILSDLSKHDSYALSEQENGFIDFCTERSLLVPDKIRCHYVYFSDVSNFLNFFKCFSASELQEDDGKNPHCRKLPLIYRQFYSVVAFVDCELNLSLEKLKEEVKTLLPVDLVNFAYYNSNEENVDEYSLDFYLDKNLNKNECIEKVNQSLSLLVTQAIKTTEASVLYSPSRRKLSLKNQQVKYGLRLLSTHKETITETFEKMLRLSNGTDGNIGLLCEIWGLLEREEDFRGFGQNFTKFPIESSLWPINSFVYNSFVYFSQACFYYYKAKMYLKCVDCALACIDRENASIIDTVSNIIINYSNLEEMQPRAVELVLLCYKIGLKKRAVLVAYKFGATFLETKKSAFWTIALDILLDIKCQDAALYTPVLANLLISVLDYTKISRTLINVLSVVGPKLETPSQKLIFNYLNAVSIPNISLNINIPIEITKCSPVAPHIKIFSENSSGRSAFIYNGISAKNKEKISISVKERLPICISIRNPFKIPISIIGKFLSDDKNIESKSISTVLQPLSTSNFQLEVIPLKSGKYLIDKFSVNLFKCVQVLDISQPIELTAVDDVPHFDVRTDLPSNKMTLYEGEWMNFNVWVLNKSQKTPITDIKLNIDNEKDAIITMPKHSLNSIAELCIKVGLKVKLKTKNISFSVVCESQSEKGKVKASISIKKELEVVPALEIRTLFPLQIRPDTLKEKDLVCFGVDIYNAGPSALLFKAEIQEKGCYFINNVDPVITILGDDSYVLLVAANKGMVRDYLKTYSDPIRVNMIKSEIEQTTNKKMTKEEFKRTEKIAGFASFIDNHLSVKWTHASGRRNGSIDKSLMIPDASFIEIIERRSPTTFTASFIEDGNVIENPTKLKDVTLRIHMSQVVNSCKLLACSIKSWSNFAWNGKLENNEPSQDYEFSLCFLESTTYQLEVKYRDGDRDESDFIQVKVL